MLSYKGWFHDLSWRALLHATSTSNMRVLRRVVLAAAAVATGLDAQSNFKNGMGLFPKMFVSAQANADKNRLMVSKHESRIRVPASGVLSVRTIQQMTSDLWVSLSSNIMLHDKLTRHGVEALFEPGSIYSDFWSKPDERAIVSLPRCYLETRGQFQAKQQTNPLKDALMCWYLAQHHLLLTSLPQHESSSVSELMKSRLEKQGFRICDTRTCQNLVEGKLELSGHDMGRLDCVGAVSVLKPLHKVVILHEDPLDRVASGMFEVFDKQRIRKERANSTTLVEALKVFVNQYRGNVNDVFGTHLVPQTFYLVRKDGIMGNISEVWLLSDLKKHIAKISEKLDYQDPQNYKSHEERANTEFKNRTDWKTELHDDTLQALCRAVAIDYCCLDKLLPKRCRGVHRNGQQIMCRSFQHKGKLVITSAILNLAYSVTSPKKGKKGST